MTCASLEASDQPVKRPALSASRAVVRTDSQSGCVARCALSQNPSVSPAWTSRIPSIVTSSGLSDGVIASGTLAIRNSKASPNVHRHEIVGVHLEPLLLGRGGGHELQRLPDPGHLPVRLHSEPQAHRLRPR